MASSSTWCTRCVSAARAVRSHRCTAARAVRARQRGARARLPRLLSILRARLPRGTAVRARHATAACTQQSAAFPRPYLWVQFHAVLERLDAERLAAPSCAHFCAERPNTPRRAGTRRAQAPRSSRRRRPFTTCLARARPAGGTRRARARRACSSANETEGQSTPTKSDDQRFGALRARAPRRGTKAACASKGRGERGARWCGRPAAPALS